MPCLANLAKVKKGIRPHPGALEEVAATGYGINHALHGGADSGRAGDRQAGAVLGSNCGPAPPLSHMMRADITDGGFPNRRQREAVGGIGGLPAQGI